MINKPKILKGKCGEGNAYGGFGYISGNKNAMHMYRSSLFSELLLQ
jgi:hypothetical protein